MYTSFTSKKNKSDYQVKYESVAQEFWEFQKTEKTDEEIEYEEKCRQLESMIGEYANELNEREQELRDKINSIENPSEIDEKLENLQIIYQNLKELQESIEKYS